jgi:hypothetical protein
LFAKYREISQHVISLILSGIARVSRHRRKSAGAKQKKYSKFLEKYGKFLEKYSKFLEKYTVFFRCVTMRDSNRGANMFSNRLATPYFVSSFGYRGIAGKARARSRK